MNLLYLIPLALLLGLAALFAFLWAMRSGQYEDLEGEANRILFEDDEPPPVKKVEKPEKTDTPVSNDADKT